MGGGLMQRGTFKDLNLVRGGLKKITTNFPVKMKLTYFFMGLTHNFHGKKGALKFLEVLKGGGGKKCLQYIFVFASAPLPLTEWSFFSQTSGGKIWEHSFWVSVRMRYFWNLTLTITLFLFIWQVRSRSLMEKQCWSNISCCVLR